MRAYQLLCLVFCAVVLAGCRPDPPLVKIGLVAPFEGRHRALGYDAIYAARLAVREANTEAGPGELHVELVALDDSADAMLARQAAASLVVDPDVVAVVGHWQPETTAAAWRVYEEGGLPLVAVGTPPLIRFEAERLPQDFRARYAAVTPFDEVAGAYAGATYDAFQLLFLALELAETSGEISRASVAASLEGLQYEGMTGFVFQPSE